MPHVIVKMYPGRSEDHKTPPASSTISRDTVPFYSDDCARTAPLITGETYDLMPVELTPLSSW